MKGASEIAISVGAVRKDFVLSQDKANSVKGAFVRLFKSKQSKKTTHHALNKISFEIKKGEFFGIVGRNGSGKSTLLKILAGIYQPTKGSVDINGKLVPFIELGVGFNPELTGRENVYLNGAMLGFSETEVESMYSDIVSFAELEDFMDQKLKNYSSGMQVRLAFSMATRSKADILLVDEVLAVGDADFQRKCFDYFKQLKKKGVTVVFVTHDMGAVREYCDRAIMIEKSEIIATGSAEEIAAKYIKLFQSPRAADAPLAEDTKRWGDNCARISTIKLSKTDLTNEDAELILRVDATAKEALDAIVVGFVVRDGAGRSLLGTNTLLKGQKITGIMANEVVTTEWHIPNIFRDGKYTLDIAINHDNGIDVHDWWEDAKSFRVYSSDYSQYIVNPPVKVEIGRETK